MNFRIKAMAHLVAPFALTLGVMADDASAQQAPLTLLVYNADAGSFHVNAVLVSGKTDAICWIRVRLARRKRCHVRKKISRSF